MGKSCRVKQSTQSKKSRRFHGNRYTKNLTNSSTLSVAPVNNSVTCSENEPISNNTSLNLSISSKKIEKIEIPHQINNKTVGYRIIDIEILSSVISQLCCKNCLHSGLNLAECFPKKKGFSSMLNICCPNCNENIEFYTSKTCSGKKNFDVNNRIIYSMRACGQGYSGLEKFTSLMNIPTPMTKNNYNKIIKHVSDCAKVVAKETMSDAVKDICQSSSNIVDTAVSVDGSWQRRGFSSLNGVVTAISIDTGKILDCEPMSRSCKACSLKLKLKENNPNAFEAWKSSHVCKLNYHGSAPGMEVTGAQRIFSRSISQNKLRYVKYYGDGDCKSYSYVKDTYPGITVCKMECVGHVQKRVGSRLRILKKNVKGLGGKGKLTNAIIDRLQNYYGIAVRQNVNNLEGMKKAILATLFHVASSAENNWHAHCPDGINSWCRYKQDKANLTSTYKPGAGLPLSVFSHLKPIYIDLSQEELLKKCLHGKTQNQNESFNGMIWQRIPKTKYVSLTQLELGVYDAVSNFNIGRKASILLFEKLNMIPGIYTLQGCLTMNKKRLVFAEYQNQITSKKRRKCIRGSKKKKDDAENDQEGCLYDPGSCSYK